jgi:hypothetical protein
MGFKTLSNHKEEETPHYAYSTSVTRFKQTLMRLLEKDIRD